MYKIIGADQKEYGPISAEQIRQWITEGRLNGDTRIQNTTSGEWKPLRDMAEFAALFPPPAAPPTITADPFKGGFGQTPATGVTNNMAKWAFGTGLFTFLCCQLLGPASIILGCLALAELKQNPHQNGRSYAIAGIVLGSFALLFAVIFVIVRMLVLPHALHF